MKDGTLPHPTLDQYLDSAATAAKMRRECERAGALLTAASLDEIWGDDLFYQLFTGRIDEGQYWDGMSALTLRAAELRESMSNEVTVR